MNPYVGPRPYEAEDAHFFFGRETEAETLLSIVISQRIVLFSAPSGAGKSSLLNTRLIPGLQREGFKVLPVGRVKGDESKKEVVPINVFVYNLLNSITGGVEDRQLMFLSLAGFLEDSLDSGDEVSPPSSRRMLIIDQFEEMMTSHLEYWEHRKGFFEQLRQAINNDPDLSVLLVLREDFIANLEPYASILPGRLQTRFFMPRMDVVAAIDAVKGPAELGGKRFAPGAVEELVDNLREIRVEDQNGKILGEYVEPVQLQVVCHQLWQNLSGESDLITAEDLEQLGNVDDALAQFYESAVQDVARVCNLSEYTLRNWFEEKLITTAGTRSLVYQDADTTAGLANEAVSRLSAAYLIRSENRFGGRWCELVHDRFLNPIQQSNKNWLLNQNPILQDAVAWDKSDNHVDFLYQGVRLDAAINQVDETVADPLIVEFLSASRKFRESQELQQRAATARRDRFMLAGVVVLLAITVLVAGRLFMLQQLAERRGAEVQTLLATQAEQYGLLQDSYATQEALGTAQAQQLVLLMDSLEAQAQLLEAQMGPIDYQTPISSGTPTAVPTLSLVHPGNPNPDPTSTSIARPTSTSMGDVTVIGLAIEATQTFTAISSQLADIRATQTAIAVTSTPPIPVGSLFAISPDEFRLSTFEAADMQNRVYVIEDSQRLPVVDVIGETVRLLIPTGDYGWANGRFLIFEGDRSKLTPQLRYRAVVGRRSTAELPFVFGKVVSASGANEFSLRAEPNDLESNIATVPVGTEVVVILSVPGPTDYGSGRWYLVDLTSDGWFWTGYLPVEAVAER